MKKSLIILMCLLVSPVAFAYPGADLSVGNSNFLILQEDEFAKEELNDYNENASLFPFLKRKPKVKINQQDINAGKELIEQDGRVLIKSVETQD